MADVYDKIRAGFEERLVALGLSYPIAWENDKFEPPDKSPWVRVVYGSTSASRKTAGNDGYSRIDGMYDIVVMWPLGDGSGAPIRVADSIVQQFKSGTRLSAGGVITTISAAWKAVGFTSGVWYQVPVTVAWYTHQNEV